MTQRSLGTLIWVNSCIDWCQQLWVRPASRLGVLVVRGMALLRMTYRWDYRGETGGQHPPQLCAQTLPCPEGRVVAGSVPGNGALLSSAHKGAHMPAAETPQMLGQALSTLRWDPGHICHSSSRSPPMLLGCPSWRRLSFR